MSESATTHTVRIPFGALVDILKTARGAWESATDTRNDAEERAQFEEEFGAMVRTLGMIIAGGYQINHYREICQDFRQAIRSAESISVIAAQLGDYYGVLGGKQI